MRTRQITAMGQGPLVACAIVACALSATSVATAADYPVLRGSQIEDAPPPPSNFNWTGVYFGGGAGQSQTRFETDDGIYEMARFSFNNVSLPSTFVPDQLVRSLPKRDSGATFFGYAGYNMQFGDAMLGIELDYTRVDQSVTASTFEGRTSGSDYVTIGSTQNAKLSDYATLRARFGYAFGRIMPYFTIGGAVGRFDTNTSVVAEYGFLDANGFRAGNYLGWPRTIGGPKKDTWGYGGVIGGGIEAGLTENLVLRAEYLLTRFGNVEGVTATVNTARVGAALKF